MQLCSRRDVAEYCSLGVKQQSLTQSLNQVSKTYNVHITCFLPYSCILDYKLKQHLFNEFIYFYCKNTNINCSAVFYIALSINKIMGIYHKKLDMYTIVQECMALTNKYKI